MISSKKMTKLAALATALAILMCLLGNTFPVMLITSEAADTMQLAGTVRPEYYAREELKKQANGDDLVKLYDLIVEAAKNNETNEEGWIEVFAYDKGLTGLDEATTGAVYLAFVADHPECFWLGQQYGYKTFPDGPVYSLVIETDDSLFALKSTFEAAIKNIVAEAGITAEMSDYEKAERLHDALALLAEYDVNFNHANAHSAYGAVVDKVCVCEGYAESYQYLLQYCGIQSLRVTGRGYKSNGTSEPHAWNLVRLDGKYYYTDVTWDDHGTKDYDIYHNYMNVTKEFIDADHTTDTAIMYALPTADSTELNYFTVNGGKMPADNLDIDFISDSISRYGYAAVNVTGDNYDNNLKSSYTEKIGEILTNIGATNGNRSYLFSSVGREYHLFVVTQCGDLRNAEHTYGEPETVTAATCTAEGTSKEVCSACGYIHLSDIPADPANHLGETEIRNAKAATETEKGYTGDTYCKACGAKTADGSEIPCIEPEPSAMLGDLTGDSSVSAEDLTALARHVAKIEIITDAELLEAADVNEDGQVDASDLTTLARYVARIIDHMGAE